MESTKQPSKNNDVEIDFFEILAKSIRAIKANLVLILLTFFGGCAIGLAYYQYTPKIYSSKMLITSDILSEPYSKSLIDNLQKLNEEGNHKTLAEKLHLSLEEVSKVNQIMIKSALEKPGDTPEDKRIFLTIEARMLDNSSWPQLQAGIIDYLRNNEFIKIRVEHKKKYANKMIGEIDLELTDLDNLKKRMTEGGLTPSSKENIVLFDPTTVNSKILDLKKEKINLQNSLETINSVQVVEGFTIFKKPASPRLSISLVSGASFGLFIAGLVIAFKGIRLLLQFSQEKLGEA